MGPKIRRCRKVNPKVFEKVRLFFSQKFYFQNNVAKTDDHNGAHNFEKRQSANTVKAKKSQNPSGKRKTAN